MICEECFDWWVNGQAARHDDCARTLRTVCERNIIADRRPPGRESSYDDSLYSHMRRATQ